MTRADFEFVAGSIAALETFRAELVRDRGQIENELDPVGTIIELLEMLVAHIEEQEPMVPMVLALLDEGDQ